MIIHKEVLFITFNYIYTFYCYHDLSNRKRVRKRHCQSFQKLSVRAGFIKALEEHIIQYLGANMRRHL